jgi:uncharacterized protein DUF445
LTIPYTALKRQHITGVKRGSARGLPGSPRFASGQTAESDDYASEIELSIGSDLQFIRMNGTLVGGVIGLLLHAVSLLLA